MLDPGWQLLYGGSPVNCSACRYILTSRGMNAMYEKYKACEFGRCPRVLCNGQPCLPVGTCDVPRQSTVKIFCPKCQDIYYPRSKYQVMHPCAPRFDRPPVKWPTATWGRCLSYTAHFGLKWCHKQQHPVFTLLCARCRNTGLLLCFKQWFSYCWSSAQEA